MFGQMKLKYLNSYEFSIIGNPIEPSRVNKFYIKQKKCVVAAALPSGCTGVLNFNSTRRKHGISVARLIGEN